MMCDLAQGGVLLFKVLPGQQNHLFKNHPKLLHLSAGDSQIFSQPLIGMSQNGK
jgi:hypothetical protein